MKRVIENKKVKYTICSIILLGIIALSLTYAYWILNRQQEGKNVVNTACLKIDFEGKDDISIGKAYPMNSEQLESFLASATPYHFTITNKCDNLQKVVINLESLIADGKQLNDEYINAILYETDYNNNLFKNKKLNEEVLNDENKVIKDARHAYKLYSFNLKNNEEKEFNLQLYLDEETPLNEDTINASWKGKITLSGEYKENTQKALPAIEYLKNVEKEESGKPSPQLIYDETEDRNLRYIGESPDNYIRFNNEIWRIIGITKVTTIDGTKEERLKIIRQSGIEGQEDIANFISSNATEQLNGTYYDDNNYFEGKYNDINKNVRISSEDARGMIDKEIEWLNPTRMYYNGVSINTPLITYQNEQNNKKEKWSAKIDIMYYNGVGTLIKSDYGLAVGNSIRENCLNVEMDEFSKNNCSTDNWLIPKDYNQYLYDDSIDLEGNIISSVSNYSVWPVVYIKKNVNIISGDGSLNSPYVLEREPVNRSKKACEEDPDSYECFLLKNDEKYGDTQLAYDGKEVLGEELGTDDNNLRYVGATPNNFVGFNDEIWRIIGVLSVKDDNGTMVRRLKIIRQDGIEGQKNFGLFAWNLKTLPNSWLEASVKEMLNNSYFNGTTGDCYTNFSMDPKTCDFSGNGDLPRGLNEQARKMVDKDVRWGIGKVPYDNTTSKEYYTNERTTEWTKENDPEYHNGVGLFYASDYGYMVGPYGREYCLKYTLYDYFGDGKDFSCGADTWLTGIDYGDDNYFISTLDSVDYDGDNMISLLQINPDDLKVKNNHFIIMDNKTFMWSTMLDSMTYPTVYLEDNVHIIENPKPSEFYGTLENPFILEQVE